MKTGESGAVTLKSSCFRGSQSWMHSVSDIRPSLIASTVSACVAMFHRQSRTSWNASEGSLHLQHHCSRNEKHIGPRGRLQRCLFCTETKSTCGFTRVTGSQDLIMIVMRRPGARCMPVVRSLRTHPVRPSVKLLPYTSLSVFLFMSLRKRVPCVPRELQTRVFTINHLRRKAPTRRCQSPKTELKVGGLNSKPRLEKWRKMQELSLCWSLSWAQNHKGNPPRMQLTSAGPSVLNSTRLYCCR